MTINMLQRVDAQAAQRWSLYYGSALKEKPCSEHGPSDMTVEG